MNSTLTFNLLIILSLLFTFLLLGLKIHFTLYGVGLIALTFLWKGDVQGFLGGLLFNCVNSYGLVALPLFILMGEILVLSKSNVPIFKGVNKILNPFPGGMLHANIISCAIFAACSGSSSATTLAIGGSSYPELIKAGYSRRITLGSIAAGGTLGILIPPSLMMIIYGSISRNSVGKLFVGGIIPGTILALLFMGWIAIASYIFPSWVPKRGKFDKNYPKNMMDGLKDIWPIIVLVVSIMGSIYLGIATPTEAASVSVIISFLISTFFYKNMTWQIIKESLTETVFLTSVLLACMIGAQAISMTLSMLQIAQGISTFVASLPLGRYTIWAILVFVYMLIGCLIDGWDLLILTTPVFYPIIIQVLHFDPIWYGVVLVVIIEMSLLTPPVGFNLFITHTIGGRKNLEDTIIGMLPFLACMIFLVILLTIYPSLVTYLPSKM
ncbi:C4-dicarboxylate TRAP transporter large permease protein DctM [subsurface metagenome]